MATGNSDDFQVIPTVYKHCEVCFAGIPDTQMRVLDAAVDGPQFAQTKLVPLESR